MDEQEQRPQRQIRRETAERFAIMVAITARKPEVKSVRQQRRAARQARTSVVKPA
jgi:hypothetical protein